MKKKVEHKNFINKNSSVFIATFSHYEKGKRLPTNGMIEPLLSFFLSKVSIILLLDQPHLVSDTINPIVEIYNKGKLNKRFTVSSFFYLPIYLFCKIPSKSPTRISYKLRDFFSVIFAAFRVEGKYDLFIGLEAINLLAGLFLKKIGKAKIVVYYVSDYSPTRFGKTLFNSIYLALDRFCVRHADFTWDVSPAMKKGRTEAGLPEQDMRRVLHVPNGLFPSQIDPLPISQRVRNSIVYMGIPDKDRGIDLIISAFALVRTKKSDATLHIIGGSKDKISLLKQIIKDYGVEKSVTYYGFIPPNKTMSAIIGRCYIGVSGYASHTGSQVRFGDSGKIRQYLGCGLPIVATAIQWYTKYAIKKGAGIGAKETPENFARAIMTLFEDEALYKRCSEKALELGRSNTWENSYLNAFLRMQKLIHSKEAPTN